MKLLKFKAKNGFANSGTAKPKNKFLNNEDCERVSLDDFVSDGRGDDSMIYVRVHGELADLNIYSGDMVIVDRTRLPRSQNLVLIETQTGFTINRYSEARSQYTGLKIVSANGKISDLKKVDKDNFEIIGVVTHKLESFV